MAERPSRITDVFEKILPPEELAALDTRRAVCRALNLRDGDELTFRDTDSIKFRTCVMKRAEALKNGGPNGHILFRDVQEDGLKSPLIEEALFWDINSDEPLDPEAAKAILRQYAKIENMPPEIHKLHFPLLMFGYMLGHSTRVAVYSALMAQKTCKNGYKYKVDPVLAAIAGFWHDIGKLEGGQKILAKTKGKYTREQFEMIKKHPVYGAMALKTLRDFKGGAHLPVGLELFDDVYGVTLKHHVRPDNDPFRSYPHGISPSELTTMTKIIALADAFDAMTTRGYLAGNIERHKQIARAYEEIRRFKGLQFDPDLAEIFCKIGAEPKDK